MTLRKLFAEAYYLFYRVFGWALQEKKDRDITTGTFGMMVRWRQAEALIEAPKARQVSGDSVAFGFQPRSRLIGHTINTAIPGCYSSTFAARMKMNVAPYRSEELAIHLLGNDAIRIAAGQLHSAHAAVDNFYEIVQWLRRNTPVRRLAWFEITALAPRTDLHKKANDVCLEIIGMVKSGNFIEVIPVRTGFAEIAGLAGQDGWLKPEFDSGDGIHCNALSYQYVWEPMYIDWLRKGGKPV